MTLEIQHITEVTEPLREAFARLLPQLSARFSAPAEELLQRVVTAPTTALYAAWDGAEVVGVLSLGWYDLPSGRKAWIEDVVVDAAARGSGAGRALVQAALAHAARIGAGEVMLTSSPARVAAHALYHKVGFEVVPTTVFTYKIDK